MSYATAQQLEDKFGNRLLVDLTDRADPPVGAVDVTVVTRAINDAQAVIDGYLAAARYELPLVAVPPLVTQLALTITIYTLHTYTPDPKIVEDYKMAVRTLEHISKRQIKLPIAQSEPKGTGGGGARVTDRERPLRPRSICGINSRKFPAVQRA